MKHVKTLTVVAILTMGLWGKANAQIENVVINEIMPANIDLLVDPSWNYGGFIEFYNPTETNIALYGYYLSDDPDNLTKWKIMDNKSSAVMRSKGFATIWFDHNDPYCKTQCPFKLDVDGGTIYFSDKSGNLLIQQDYPAAVRRCSYARTTDGGDEWRWGDVPTQGKTNTTAKFADVQLDLPVVNKPGQVFSGTLQVTVNIPVGATLRYTTNGSVPTMSNGYTSTTGTFTVTKSIAYRFRLFQNGYLPSDVLTCSYIKNEKDFCVPILSVVTDDKNLNSADYGIFVEGNGHGRPGRCDPSNNTSFNWNMDWDRPVSMEYFADGKEVSFAQEVNMAMCGGWSRAWTPHSFKLKANKVYGIKYMPYSFFPEEKPYIKTKTLQVRNGGNGASDNGKKFTDALLQRLISTSGIDIDYQSCQPAFVYINGALYNVLNIREANNKHFAYANRGLDDDEMDQFEIDPDSNYVQMEGTREAFSEWYRLSKNATDSAKYERIKELVDIDEYINYMAIQFYLGGDDWPQNNVKGYRPRMEGGKFRFVVFDLDFAFNKSSNTFTDFTNKQRYTFNKLKGIYSGQLVNSEIEFVTIFLNMLANEEFRKQFIDTYCIVAGSIFDPTRCNAMIKEYAEYAESAYSQIQKSSGWWGPSTETVWDSANNAISNLGASRQTTMISTLKNESRMKLTGKTSVRGTIRSSIDEGRILMNGQPLPTGKFNGQLFPPMVVRAEAPAGYKFKGWHKGGTTKKYNVFQQGSSWYYYDKGSLDGTDWKSSSYTETWSNGATPIGYRTGSTWSGTTIKTQVAQKKPTYYFRKSFSLGSAPDETYEFTLSLWADDGCVVYVNGKEAGRFNMPEGNVTYNSFASQYCDDFAFPQTIILPYYLFQKGTNLIAVEVHNNEATSSDALWNAALSYTAQTSGGLITTDQEYTIPAAGSFELNAVWERMTDDELAADRAVPVRINEVSAGNSVYVNEYFDKEDWVELYNTTDKSIDLAGMYLSDNINKPTKFQFQAGDVSTVIEPYGYRVVWCDKVEAQSQLHTSFKLGNEPAFVVLTASDQTWADTLQYCAHDGSQTVGRYPDGSNTVYAMNVPTIGKSNTICSYDTVHIELNAEGVEHALDVPTVITRDGGMSIAYVNGYVLVKSEKPTVAQLVICTPAGQQVASASLDITDSSTSYAVNLPSGLYIASVRDAEGRKCVTKFYR